MLNREYVRDFGTIHQYNFKLAMRNFINARTELHFDIDQLNRFNYDACEMSRSRNDFTPNMSSIHAIVKDSKMALEDARDLVLAASDLEATAQKQFPSELAPIRHVCREDPRDWFFDFVNIGNCHDCPLHAGLEDTDKQTHPCGARECIIKQLCEMIGYR